MYRSVWKTPLFLSACLLCACVFADEKAPGAKVSDKETEELVEGTFQAEVIAVPMGDFYTIKRKAQSLEVRLYGADCPESGQACAEEAQSYARAHLVGKTVEVEVVATDSLGNPVVRMTAPGGWVAHEDLIAQGLAWWDQENVPQDKALKQLAAKAILATAGLWGKGTPLAPWDYRRSHGMAQYSYSLQPAKKNAAAAKEEEEIKTLSAKGDAKYTTGGYVVNLGDLKLDQKIDEAELLMKHMPTVAHDDQGKPMGLAVPNINQIPYASQLGFRDGDVITGVNGQAVHDMGQLYSMADRLKKEKQFRVDIMRNGRPDRITINLP